VGQGPPQQEARGQLVQAGQDGGPGGGEPGGGFEKGVHKAGQKAAYEVRQGPGQDDQGPGQAHHGQAVAAPYLRDISPLPAAQENQEGRGPGRGQG